MVLTLTKTINRFMREPRWFGLLCGWLPSCFAHKQLRKCEAPKIPRIYWNVAQFRQNRSLLRIWLQVRVLPFQLKRDNWHLPADETNIILDYAWPNTKTYIEVDGEQHYTEKGLEHDKIRTEYLESIGWKCIIRIRWSLYNKLKYEERKKFIDSIDFPREE